jgi:hypothetical protein
METPPEKVYAQMVECFLARERGRFTPGEASNVIHWLRENVFVLDCLGGRKLKDILDAFAYLRALKGVRFGVIDSITTLSDVDEYDPGSQIRAMKEIVRFAWEHNMHIAVIGHMGKPSKDKNGNDRPQDRHAWRGASALKDLVQTVVLVRRSKEKRQAFKDLYAKLKEGQINYDEMVRRRQNEWDAQPDTYLEVDKQRASGHTPTFELWYHACRQFVSGSGSASLFKYDTLLAEAERGEVIPS